MSRTFITNTFLYREQDSKVLLMAVLASVLLHAAGLVLFHWKKPPTLQPIEISLLSRPEPRDRLELKRESPLQDMPQLPKQYVSASQAPEREPTVPTRLLSEKSSSAEKETIKRGDSLAEPLGMTQPKPKQKEKETSAKKKTTPTKAAALNKSPTKPTQTEPVLRLSETGLEEALKHSKPQETERATESATEDKPVSDVERNRRLSEYKPFQRAGSSLTGSLFSGRMGSSDFLPNIPDGDITLLNAKADRFAVFVRRVALQVFGSLRQKNWAQIPFSEAVRVRDFVTVEAIMDSSGKLLSAKMVDSCGIPIFDRILVDAAMDGAWDQNPPTEAQATDGNIHFIFKARTWAQPRGNGLTEGRWLLLGTGLL